MAKDKADRTEYHSDYYADNKDKLSESRSQWNADFKTATSYFRQKMLFGRELPNLIARISPSIVEKARVDYEKVIDQYA